MLSDEYERLLNINELQILLIGFRRYHHDYRGKKAVIY